MHNERSAPASPITHRLPLSPSVATAAWAFLSLAGVASILALVWPVGQLEQLAGLAHPLTLGVWAFAWVQAAGLLALLAARLTFGSWLGVPTAAWLILLSGAVVSAATVGILADWTIARFGYNESELVGPMSLLFGVIAGVAVAGFGVRVAPRWAAWPPLIAVVVGALIGTAIILSNAPGLADGLGNDSGPVAAATVVAAVYIWAVGALSVARLRHR